MKEETEETVPLKNEQAVLDKPDLKLDKETEIVVTEKDKMDTLEDKKDVEFTTVQETERTPQELPTQGS